MALGALLSMVLVILDTMKLIDMHLGFRVKNVWSIEYHSFIRQRMTKTIPLYSA